MPGSCDVPSREYTSIHCHYFKSASARESGQTRFSEILHVLWRKEPVQHWGARANEDGAEGGSNPVHARFDVRCFQIQNASGEEPAENLNQERGWISHVLEDIDGGDDPEIAKLSGSSFDGASVSFDVLLARGGDSPAGGVDTDGLEAELVVRGLEKSAGIATDVQDTLAAQVREIDFGL